MTCSPIAPNVNQPPYVLIDLPSQISFHQTSLIYDFPDSIQVFIRQIFYSRVVNDPCLVDYIQCHSWANPIDTGQCSLNPFRVWYVYSCYYSHQSPLSLSLLMLGVFADNPYPTFTTNNPALSAPNFHGSANLHNLLHFALLSLFSDTLINYLNLYVILPLVKSYGDRSTSTLSPGKTRM